MWEAFNAYDTDRSGNISVLDLKKALEYVGETVSEHKVNWLISMSDPQNTGFIQFNQFKEIVMDKREQERGSSEEELLQAFVAMGGEADGEGAINAEKLISTIKEEFGMTIDIEKLI
jgi:calmodulin